MLYCWSGCSHRLFAEAYKWISNLKEKQPQNRLQRSKLNCFGEVVAPHLAPYKMGIKEGEGKPSLVHRVVDASLGYVKTSLPPQIHMNLISLGNNRLFWL